MANPRPDETIISDSEDIFDYSDRDNAAINLEMRLPGQTSCRNGKVYKMSEGKRGRCLIINNYKFKSFDARDGSEVDVINLTTVLKELRFQVIIKKNISSYNFEEVIVNELQHPDHEKWGMFALIIMSHGGENNKIYGTDDIGIDQHRLLKRVYNCQALKGKPKFIIIQACAGNDTPKCKYDNAPAARPPLGYTDCSAPLSHPDSTGSELPDDVLVLKSAFDGFASLRYEEFGSPFIRALVEALYKHAHHCDAETICKRVQNKMRLFNRRAERLKTEKAPLPSYISFLRYSLHLFPANSADVEDSSSSSANEVYSSDFESEDDEANHLHRKMDPKNPEAHTALWVGNVSRAVKEKDLEQLFGKYGMVIKVRCLPDKYCAFINFQSKEAAGSAMNALQDHEIQGRKLLIKFPDNPKGSKHKKLEDPTKAPGKVYKARGPVNGDECYFWRTGGCKYDADKCRYKHLEENRGIDKKPGAEKKVNI